MKGIFSNLLVSSPNGGGLFFINAEQVKKLDSFNSVGLFAVAGKFFRGIQPDSLWIYGDSSLKVDRATVAIGDVHDVLEFEGHIYVVGTTGNEIIKLDPQGVEQQRWRFPGEDDSRHVNCLGVWNGKVVYSAFGEFTNHRGYKGMSDGNGFVNDLLTGQRLISGLSQPHTPVGHGGNLLLANSERSEIHEYGPDAVLLRKKTLPGYTRGICITEDAIYVGISKSRNLDAGGLPSATLLALHPKSWEELGRIVIPATEIYSVLCVADDSELLETVSEVASHTAFHLESQISELNNQATAIHVESMRRREFITAISDQLRAWLSPFYVSTEASSADPQDSLQSIVRAQSLGRFFDRQNSDEEISAVTNIKMMLEAAIAISNAQEAFDRERIKQLEVIVADFLDNEQVSKVRLLEFEEMIAIFRQKELSDGERLQELERMVDASDASGRASMERLLELEATLEALQLDVDFSRKDAQREIDSYRASLELISRSRTWRWTEPVRRANTDMSKMKKRVKDDLYRVYRGLPIASHNKQKLKGVLFRYFGFVFKDLMAYKVWKDYQERSISWPVADAKEANPASLLPATSIQNIELANADGVWEWKDYPEVRARIAQLKAAERSKFNPRALNVLDITPSAFTATVAGLNFRAPGDSPLVSIIIPVFNNVKLTLECLASINEHTPKELFVEIIIADDASTDETQSLIQPLANVKYIRNDKNLGFLLNCNNALDQVTGSFTVYLNNDVQVTAGWLESLLSTFDEYENVGAVGPKFVYPSGHLQEAGASLLGDGTATMVGLNGDPNEPRYNYTRRVDYVSGACLLTPTELLRKLGGFSEEFLPCYCEDSDLCMSIRSSGYDIYYNPGATIIHHLSKTTAAGDESFKLECVSKNVSVLNRKWSSIIEKRIDPRVITFFLPQFHPVPENDLWWGKGFTEWTNVSKARPNFVGHYQPRIPADHGYYDLRLLEVLQAQASLAQRYGVHGFCFYYYWFDGKRLLERPVEQLLLSEKPDIPFCLCWANENWTRRWDGQEHEVLMAQAHTDEDDVAVIYDLIRFFKDDRYIKIDGRPLILIYRATLFPDFAKTAATWRKVCREQGLGEIYIAMVESFELVQSNTHPSALGCDAAVEFPPQGLAEVKQPTGEIINPEFTGHVADYRDLAVRYATRPAPGYTRFKGVMPGWDNTARRPHTSFCFENASPGAFQAWLEESIADTKEQNFGDERLVFVNAWNEWAEGAYLEPDRRFGHTYLEAVRNAIDASRLLKKTEK